MPRLHPLVGLRGLFEGQDGLYLHPELTGIEYLRELLQLAPLGPRTEPDVVLGQQVMPGPAGLVSHRAGTKENVIPDEATIKLNVRAFDQDVCEKVLGAIERIVETEAEASDALKSPEITPINRYPLTVNCPDATGRVLGDYFDHDGVEELSAPVPASKDFGAEWHAPSVFWHIDGTDPDAYDKAKQAGRISQDIPTNHSPNFAPVIHPTLETGVEDMVVAARAWLSP